MVEIGLFLQVDGKIPIRKIRDTIEKYFTENYGNEISHESVRNGISNDNHDNFFLYGKENSSLKREYIIGVKIKKFVGLYHVDIECSGISYDRDKDRYFPEGFCPNGKEPKVMQDLEEEMEKLDSSSHANDF